MEVTYDPEVDALYVKFRRTSGQIVNREVAPGIYHVLDAHKRLVGIEVLDASVHLGKAALEGLRPPESWLTLAEAEAEATRQRSPIVAATLRRLLASGDLAGRKIGKTWQIDGAALLTYLANRPALGRPKAPSYAEHVPGRGAKVIHDAPAHSGSTPRKGAATVQPARPKRVRVTGRAS